MASASGEKKGKRRQGAKPIGLPGRHGALRAHRSMLSAMPLAIGNCKERPESASHGDAEMALHLVPTVSTCLG